MKRSIKKLSTFRKHHTNFDVFVTFVGVMLCWRGIWGILDEFLFPNNHALSYAISVLFGLFILYSDDHKIDELH